MMMEHLQAEETPISLVALRNALLMHSKMTNRA